MINFPSLWLLFDIISIMFLILNVILIICKKRKYVVYVSFLSVLCECLAILASYQQVLNAIINNNIGYILDVIPNLNNIRTPIVSFILIINIILLVIHLILNYFAKKH